VAPLPRAWVVALAAGLGELGFRFSRRDKRIALANLDVAFGAERSAAEKRRIARESFRTFALVLLDLFWFQFRTRPRIARWFRFDPSFDVYWTRSPWVVVTAHYGNWEVMGQAAALRGHGSVSVTAPLANPLVDRLLRRWRRVTGQQVVARQGAVRSLLTTLRQGGRVALLADQNTLPSEGGEFVDFFGAPVPISNAAAVLSRHTGADILMVFCAVEPGGRYRAFALEPMKAGARGQAARDVTEVLARRIEGVIREAPGPWLWMYKRWKTVPRGVDPARYPFYARAS
jgi:KDO2-lipid IV(A) lauroyltransferase